MESDPNRLIERFRNGDTAAAAELIEMFYTRIFSFLRRLAGNEADAADLTQQTFTRVWNSLVSFAGRSSVSSWMHGIAHHVYVDWRRASGRTEPRPDDWWAARMATDRKPDEQAARSDMDKAVYACVDGLDPELRDTIHLHYYQELTLQETADALGIATSTVKYRLRQALDQLQKKMQSEPTPKTQNALLATKLL